VHVCKSIVAACVCVVSLRCQKEGVEDTKAVEDAVQAEYAREEDMVFQRQQAVDEATRQSRVFPPGTAMSLRAYDPSGSGFGAAVVSGERLSRLVLGAREIFR
jgi:hypothetical protein